MRVGGRADQRHLATRVMLAGCAALVAVVVVRNAIVGATIERHPALARAGWSGQPRAILADGLVQIGHRAATGQAIGPADTAPLVAAARWAPLAPEPYLVAGIAAQSSGDEALAGRLFEAGLARDPRSRAGLYLLADHDQRIGRSDLAMAELGLLASLSPGTGQAIAERLAGYARQPGAAAQIRMIVARQPGLREFLLNRLASDPANDALVVAIAGPVTAADAHAVWPALLARQRVERGEVDRAVAVWAASGGLVPGEARALANALGPRASDRPPFDWTLASGAAGTAEGVPGGGLHLLYYGRDPLTMASRQLLLEPGRYRLKWRVTAASGDVTAIGWRLACVPGNRPIDQAPLTAGRMARELVIPLECRAEQLAFAAVPGELPATTEATVAELALEAVR